MLCVMLEFLSPNGVLALVVRSLSLLPVLFATLNPCSRAILLNCGVTFGMFCITTGGEESCEHKMKKVIDDMKARPSIRANKDWDLTDKISREGQEIIKEIVKKGEITQAYRKKLSPSDCKAPQVT